MANEDVAIVKMDATANDVPAGFDVRGFPTLYWIPKDAKDKPIRYEVCSEAIFIHFRVFIRVLQHKRMEFFQGGRELEDFVKYIASKATNELKGFDRSGKSKSGKDEL